MLQSRLTKQIEHTYRLRLLYALHLTLYGVMMVVGVLTVDPSRWQMMIFFGLAWLPVLLAHTTAQTVVEMRQRCESSYQPALIPPANRFNLPVIIYDEQGKPMVGGDEPMNFLPR